MKRLFLCVLLIILSCEDRKSAEKKASEPDAEKKVRMDSIEEKKAIDSSKIKEPEFPVLTEENAMDFFLEYEKENKEDKVRIYTDFGEIDILLYPKTKFHRANFIYLTKRQYFDSTQFYRVINNFMVQAGNTDDPDVKRKRKYIGRYLLPKDTKRGYTHDRGAVSMPSSEIDNPHKLASPYEFFIVQNPRGEYRLDGDYTIFGKVIGGMEVVDKIAAVDTDEANWPLKNVYIKKVEIID